MARTEDTPMLSPGNHIYLYRLLSGELGTGKQTFLPAVEQALASGRMTAEDLGFENTRALLEQLDDFIKLTVFKGGRIYATVIAQPVWDETLAALASGKNGKSGANSKSNKPWKRKKTDKSLKPVRPKRVKRPNPDAIVETTAPEQPAPSSNPETPDMHASTLPGESDCTDATDRQSPQIAAIPPIDTEGTPTPEQTELTSAPASTGDVTADADSESTHIASDETRPLVSLTVTYDPYSGIDTETKLEARLPRQASPVGNDSTARASSERPSSHSPASSPLECVPEAHRETTPMAAINEHGNQERPHAPSAQTAACEHRDQVPQMESPARSDRVQPAAITQAQTPARTLDDKRQPKEDVVRPSLSPEIISTYPTEFAEEVYLPSDIVAALCEFLPYGTDVFALLHEDYSRARSLELLSGTRARCTFPLRILHADSLKPIEITLKKRSGTGLAWELASTR